jgi:hypothetical protein
MYGTVRGTQWGYSLYEFQVYGGGSPPAGCVEPTNPQADLLYSCASTLRKPIPPGTPYHPSDATMRQGMIDANAENGTHYNPFYLTWPAERTDYPTASTPLVTVSYDQQYPTRVCNYKLLQVPITGTVQPTASAGSGESHYIVLQPDGVEWDFYKMTSPQQTPLSDNASIAPCPADGYWHTNFPAKHPSGNPNDTTGNGWKGLGYCVGGTPYLNDCASWKASHIWGASDIRKRDFQIPSGNPDSTFGHAISVAFPNISQKSSNPWGVPFVPPANSTDGMCKTRTTGTGSLPANECIPMGARVQLDPSFPCNTHPSLVNAAEWKRVLCRTLQVYGGIVGETGTGAFNDDGRYKFVGLLGFSASDYEVPWDFMPYMHVINWNVWTGV